MNEEIDSKIEKSEDEIDLVELVRKVWVKRWFIVKTCCIGGIVGLVVAFSTPKVYTTTVVLAPETNSGGGGNMGALAAFAGISLPQKGAEISPDLYPDIVKTTPFLLGLLDLRVVDHKRGVDTDLYSYLRKYQKSTWWSAIFRFPFKVLGWLRVSSSSHEQDRATTVPQKIISLSKEQSSVLKALKDCMNVTLDKKTFMIKLSTTLQSAEISAHLVDTLTSYLQEYIINYRTEKARQDLASTQKLHDECQQNYFEAQQRYAEYIDRNQKIVRDAFRTKELRLENEMNLAFTTYNQMAQQLQMAKIKVQDETPVCKVIQPAVVPLVPSAPNKKMMLVGFVFLAFAGACGWVLFGKEFFGAFKM